MTEELARKYAFYRLTGAQREIYRLLANAERSDGGIITKMWHELENEVTLQR